VLDAAPARLDVRRVLAQLPTADRALLLGRYGLGLTQGALAESLGVPEGTAKVRLHRLRKQLRGALAE
jgi:RNA polymerase sigma-70 factor (ECF subfamily)